MSRVAVLGIGAMGFRLAQNLLNANHEVIVYNRTPDKVALLLTKGAIYKETPREAAESADIVISMVTDNYASRSIWLHPETGAAIALRKDAIAIESSTLTVTWVRELAATFENLGVAFLDAPVVGSRPQADAGKLIYLVGGKAETLTQVQDILLSAGGSTIHYIGSIGQGMAMKLAVNALFGIQVVALAEIIGMLNKNRVALPQAIECLADLPVTSPITKTVANLILADNHTAMFPIELVEKDFCYVTQTAQAVGAQVPVSMSIHDIYQEAIAKGYGSDNITSVARLFI